LFILYRKYKFEIGKSRGFYKIIDAGEYGPLVLIFEYLTLRDGNKISTTCKNFSKTFGEVIQYKRRKIFDNEMIKIPTYKFYEMKNNLFEISRKEFKHKLYNEKFNDIKCLLKKFYIKKRQQGWMGHLCFIVDFYIETERNEYVCLFFLPVCNERNLILCTSNGNTYRINSLLKNLEKYGGFDVQDVIKYLTCFQNLIDCFQDKKKVISYHQSFFF
jgi:hypothetical protein